MASSKTQYGVGTPATTPHVVNVLHKGVRLCPSHNQVAAVIRDELLAKVLVPKIAQYRADELRGNAGLLAELGQVTSQELQPTCGLWGLTLENFFLNWGLTEQEQAEIEQARARREEQAINFVHQLEVREMERGLELERTRLANLQEIKVLEARGDQELEDVYLAAEIDRDQLLDGQRVDTSKVDAQVRSIELDLQRQEANLKLETERQQADLQLGIQRREAQARIDELEAESRIEMSEMEHLVNLQSRRKAEKHLQELEMRRVDSDPDFTRRKQEQESQSARRRQDLDATLARMGMIERPVAQGLDAGVTDASVLRMMLEQSTEQEYAQTSDAKVEARSDAQAGRHSVEGLREEQDRERAHQAEMTRLASDMMEASKQTPSTLTPGQAESSPPQQQGPTINVTSVSGSPKAPATVPMCFSCSAAIQPGWKACPQCGAAVSASPQCPNCQNTVEAAWKACPHCGTSLAR